ncbi:hypothetical protein ABFS83_14G039500 [Erythranthe nasuta]
MAIPHHLLLLLLPFLLLSAAAAADDSAVMSKLLSSLSPPPTGWSSATNFCNWTNVKCDPTNSFVTAIDLDSAAVSGTLPPELNQLSQLQSLNLQKNSITGTLPSFQNITTLQQILLDDNSFTSIPDNFLLGLTNLQTFSISQNYKLSPWQIPNYLSESTNLVNFFASNSTLKGTIPDFFNFFPNLQNLRLSYNDLTGSLPGSLSGSEIQNLWLNNQIQGLSGTINVLSNMTQLSQVWLHANAFSGGIPDLSTCENLFDLQLRDNKFTGIVPPSLLNLPNLVNITLQNNRLQGPYPQFSSKVEATIGVTNSFCLEKPGPCDPQVSSLLDIAGSLGYPLLLADSWKGNNPCQNWRFVNCDSLGKNITIVNMARQGFSGTISPSFANLTSLRNLVLNDNKLSGSIPSVLTSLPQLQNLDVSNNNLSGEILVFPANVKFNYGGNSLLGKNESRGCCDGAGANPMNADGSSSKASSPIGMIVGVILAVLVFVGVVMFVSYKVHLKRRGKIIGRVEGLEEGTGKPKTNFMIETQSQNSGDHSQKGESMNSFSIEILRQVTNNFGEENILGRGGFGVVYKGVLVNGTKIAVKRMESGAATKGLKEFESEIAVLTKVRHRHLVALLGYCINGNERLLVYEYMPQGTLAQHLFERQGLGCDSLSWKQRVTVALDVARGVEYLHSLAQQSFIHRDLKPSNILLSDDMRAKVADFGLVKNAPDGNCSVETRLAGTFGYLAPEYAATGRVTTKVDVYAFGVVLMEIITGRKALDETMPYEKSHLVTWFRRVLVSKDNLKKSIDPTLEPDDATYESICKVAELAGHCTAREPYQRPDMGHAVNVLGPLVERWMPTRPEEEEASSSSGIDLHMSLPQILQRWQHDEGSSRMFYDDDLSFSTQSSIPSKPSGIKDSVSSMDCR